MRIRDQFRDIPEILLHFSHSMFVHPMSLSAQLVAFQCTHIIPLWQKKQHLNPEFKNSGTRTGPEKYLSVPTTEKFRIGEEMFITTIPIKLLFY